MLAFSQWIAGTPLSKAVGDALWLIPLLQIVHIIALALLFTSVAALGLRAYGHFAIAASPAQLARRFQPWVWISLLFLAITGVIEIVGEPVRDIVNWALWIKMPLIFVACAATLAYFKVISRLDETEVASSSAKARNGIAAIVGVWLLIIIFGRLVAYAQIVQ